MRQTEAVGQGALTFEAELGLREEALRSTVTHLVGRSRAFLLELRGAREEMVALRDDRAEGLVAAVSGAIGDGADAVALGDMERAATAMLRSLVADSTSSSRLSGC
jgi:hypothetical protein